MIGNLSDREFVIIEGINLRKGFSGLMNEVELIDGVVDFFNNRAFVFINRRRNMFKCLYWENEGLALWNKRLSKGTFTKLGDISRVYSFKDFILYIHGYIPPENL